MDLMLWGVLMGCKALVRLLWTQKLVPFRGILLASTVCRGWIKCMKLQGHLRERLMEDAAEYEQMAMEVQLLLMHKDSKAAQR